MKKHIAILMFLIFGNNYLFAQELISYEIENIKTEKIVDYFKDTIATKPIKVNYTFYAFPNLSSYQINEKKEALELTSLDIFNNYQNYLSIGFGSYATPYLEAFSNLDISKNQTLDLAVFHHSSQGDVPNTRLNTNFSTTKLSSDFKHFSDLFLLGINATYRRNVTNWYGVPDFITEQELRDIDEKQIYHDFDTGLNVEIENIFLKRFSFKSNFFSDNTESNESNFILNLKTEFYLSNFKLFTDFNLDILHSKIKSQKHNDIPLKDENLIQLNNISTFFSGNEYSNILFNITPYIKLSKNTIDVELGVNTYIHEGKNKNKAYFYPNITANYKLINEYFIPYLILTGSLRKNSFKSLTNANPYISPASKIQYTNFIDFQLGLKGKLFTNLSYNLKAQFQQYKNQPIFYKNLNILKKPTHNYSFGNSFDISYDDLDNFSLNSEISMDIEQKLNLNFQIEVNSYTAKNNPHPWNLAALKANLFADYKLDDNWFLISNIFFVGDRKDYKLKNIGTNTYTVNYTTLKEYLDINLQLDYKYSSKLSVFLKLNNLGGNNYQRWAKFNVQGTQVLGGISYKF